MTVSDDSDIFPEPEYAHSVHQTDVAEAILALEVLRGLGLA